MQWAVQAAPAALTHAQIPRMSADHMHTHTTGKGIGPPCSLPPSRQWLLSAPLVWNKNPTGGPDQKKICQGLCYIFPVSPPKKKHKYHTTKKIFYSITTHSAAQAKHSRKRMQVSQPVSWLGWHNETAARPARGDPGSSALGPKPLRTGPYSMAESSSAPPAGLSRPPSNTR